MQDRIDVMAGLSACYSHSMVPGGLLVRSRVTRLIPGTSLMMRVLTPRKVFGSMRAVR